MSAEHSITPEEWRPIPSHPHYEASSLGRIRSLPRVIRKTNRWGRVAEFEWKGRVMKSRPDKDGYLRLNLGAPEKRLKVHALVAEAWIGLCPDGKEVNHKDGIKANNSPGNLEYVTPAGNTRHACETGLRDTNGEANGNAVLTTEGVREILASSDTNANLARRLGCSTTTIEDVRRGRTWRHLHGKERGVEDGSTAT